uniref:acylphosphatase n=1 Tax=Octopus bimaculoides TaxID=37653 RepID=A0A0L8GQ97_OCTBM
MSGKFVTVNYEVFGKVQGVFFRKCTQIKAKELNVVGWVMNTNQKTVKGVIQGSREQIVPMKKWLSEEGSPSSSIEKCEFSKEVFIPTLKFKKFEIIR